MKINMMHAGVALCATLGMTAGSAFAANGTAPTAGVYLAVSEVTAAACGAAVGSVSTGTFVWPGSGKPVTGIAAYVAVPQSTSLPYPAVYAKSFSASYAGHPTLTANTPTSYATTGSTIQTYATSSVKGAGMTLEALGTYTATYTFFPIDAKSFTATYSDNSGCTSTSTFMLSS
jgi:hypothetical protein